MPLDEHEERYPDPADGRFLQRAREAGPCYGPRIALCPPSRECCERLARVHRADAALRRQLQEAVELPPGIGAVDGPEFLRSLRAWSEHRHGIPYAVLGPGGVDPVGLIALYDLAPGSALGSVGFWLASAAWDRGYAGEALALLVRHAVGLGLHRFEARVPRSRTAVWHTWSRLGALIAEDTDPGRYHCTLETRSHGFDAALAHALRG